MNKVDNGQAYRMIGGGVYRYKCWEGYYLLGSDTIYCDGQDWSNSVPTCAGIITNVLISNYEIIISEKLTNGSQDHLVPSPFLSQSSRSSMINPWCLLVFILTIIIIVEQKF